MEPGEWSGSATRTSSIVAIGAPAFSRTLGEALGVDLDGIEGVPSVTAAEEMLLAADVVVDVLVLSPDVKEPDALGLAGFVGRSTPGTAIVLVRDDTDSGMLTVAMRAGIRDVVDLSDGTEDLRDAVERAISWAENLRAAGHGRGDRGARGKVISVFSSKGGTGKTFLVTNVAAAIADLTGEDTAIVDLDFDMGDVFSYFGRESEASLAELMELGDGADDEEIREAGIRLGAHLYGYGAPVDPTAEIPHGETIGAYLRALRSSFSYVLIDASVDYSDAALVCFDLSDVICLITGLDVVGVKHLSKALDTLLAIGIPRERFRVVLNRADSKVGLSAADVERVMNIEVDALLPSSVLVPTSLNRGVPVVLDEPTSDVSYSVRTLAGRLTGRPVGDPPPLPAVGRKWFRMFARR